MEKITWTEFEALMWKHNEDNNITTKGQDRHPITGVVVYKQGDWFKKEYTEIERSYRVSSSNKAFIPGQIGRSIFADCLGGTEHGVRLDWYNNWEVDYCYMEDENDGK